MKRFVIFIAMLLAMLMLAGCANGKLNESQIVESESDNMMFFVVSDEQYGNVIVCKKTNVMYWQSNGSYNRGTLTLLVDADGKPMIWKG